MEEEWTKGKAASGEEEESFDDIIKAGAEEEIKVTTKNLEILRTRVSKLEEEKAFRVAEQVCFLFFFAFFFGTHTHTHTHAQGRLFRGAALCGNAHAFAFCSFVFSQSHTHTNTHTHRGVFLGCWALCGIAHACAPKSQTPSRAPTSC